MTPGLIIARHRRFAGVTRGRFRLEKHKNSDKGVEVEGALHEKLVAYLRSIMPSDNPSGPIHVNPKTGAAYVTIRKQWNALKAIANSMLPADEQLTGRRGHFYTWRHTGASSMAADGIDPVKIVRFMGDSSITTVMRHYFNSSVEEMAASIKGWAPFGRRSDENEDEQLRIN